MANLPETLKDNVRLLGELLGKTLHKHEGEAVYEKVEEIRALSKSLTSRSTDDFAPLIALLESLDDKDILPITRSFNQFLNLANIADQEYFSSSAAEPLNSLTELFKELACDNLQNIIQQLQIELVLTAHPTEVTRRTLIHKYERISTTLSDRSRQDLVDYEDNKIHGRLHRLVEEVWSTDEIRATRPTAVDEATWGFAVIENSLWDAVPDFVRHLDRVYREQYNEPLPLDIAPFRFYSWMGGDRDGNPNVTHDVTREVILLGRWKAADLYIRDLYDLGDELSMHEASKELVLYAKTSSRTPYREVLSQLRLRLKATRKWIEEKLDNESALAPDDVIISKDQILEPLLICYRSLVKMGHDRVANGPLINLIHRIYAFGLNLVPLDIRQDGERHVQFLEELCNYLDMGDYTSWDEEKRQAFLLEQLTSKRPLLPQQWPMSDEAAEVLATCKVIAEQPRETLSDYVISMAQQPSDVLAVALLLKESGVNWNMPIVPLFETLDDLDRSATVMERLWQISWYRDYIGGEQTVMIGYSDSAKDAGKFAATWAQYKAQEKLIKLASDHDIDIKLFHGRGGTVGRGGGPVEKAMASQPPGSVHGKIRVTEQGEMIRYKFGMPRVAFRSLNNYVAAVLKATVNPQPAPPQEWRDLTEKMAQVSLQAYRSVVREHPDFVPYFRNLTPEQELSKLALGSRPAKRKATGGVESLRAIPWVFAWMQVRLNLPSWLGARQALEYAQQNEPETLKAMTKDWAFFSSFLDLLEMVVGKADAPICSHYEKQLVDPSLHGLGIQLRDDLGVLETQLNDIKNQSTLLESDPMLQQSIEVRKPYVDPLNYLQAELLKRERKTGDISPDLERALKVTMTGIAAGMRNTG